jgi:hypothetical protein
LRGLLQQKHLRHSRRIIHKVRQAIRLATFGRPSTSQKVEPATSLVTLDSRVIYFDPERFSGVAFLRAEVPSADATHPPRAKWIAFLPYAIWRNATPAGVLKEKIPTIPLRLKRIRADSRQANIRRHGGIRHAPQKRVSRKRKREEGSTGNRELCFHPLAAFV